jgi:glycerate 2-kinase
VPTRPAPAVLAAPDKLRGTLDAAAAAEAIARGAEDAGWEGVRMPLADGGEGTLDVLGGPDRWSSVTGPLGVPVRASWRFGDGDPAVVESARACGLALAGGAGGNDPEAATSTGVGELVGEAVLTGARRVVVALGGTASTDGGLGAVEALLSRLGATPAERGVELLVACDVDTRFTEAARVFAPQKGAGPVAVARLEQRLRDVAAGYRERFGLDVTELDGAGAAGGLGGGLVAVGGRLVSGFDLVSDHLELAPAVGRASLVVTAEGAVDRQSLHGKVVGGVLRLARAARRPVLVVAGTISPEAAGTLDELQVPWVGLTTTFGEQAAWQDTAGCLRRAVADHLRALPCP